MATVFHKTGKMQFSAKPARAASQKNLHFAACFSKIIQELHSVENIFSPDYLTTSRRNPYCFCSIWHIVNHDSICANFSVVADSNASKDFCAYPDFYIVT
jgi:hypothetical protein